MMDTTMTKNTKNILFPKKAAYFISIMFFILMLAQPVFADEGLQNETILPETGENTEITIPRYFIGLDFSDPEQIFVYESMVFVKGEGSNYTGYLATWVPENAEIIEISRKEMSGGGDPVTPPHSHNGNLLIIDDLERLNSEPMPPIYTIRYTISASEIEEGIYTKVLKDQPHPSYPISSLTIEIIPAEGTYPAITTEDGYEIEGQVEETDDGIIYSWSNPQFKEIRIGTEKTDDSTIKSSYFLAIIPLLIVIYVVMNRSNKSGKGKTDLKDMKIRHESILSVLKEMKNDLDSGKISKEDYDHISDKYTKEADDLARKMDQIKNKKD